MQPAKMIAKQASGGVEDWLRRLETAGDLSRAGHDVVQALVRDPNLASYASASEIAGVAGVNVATVTRTAQSVGFSGWPQWRQEIRARYLGTLSAPELNAVHRAEAGTGQPFDDTVNRHLQQVADLRRSADRQAVRLVADGIAKAERRLIIGSGSFASIARILAHHATLIGYRCELAEDGVAIANSLGDIGPNDIVVVATFWRLYNSAIRAAHDAKARGAKVCVITDAAVEQLTSVADHLLVVPAESASFFATVVPGLCLVEGISAELAMVDPERSARSIAAFEEQWQAQDLLHFQTAPMDSKRTKAQGPAPLIEQE